MTQQELKRAVNDWQLNYSTSTWVDYYQNIWQYGINKKDRQRDYKRNGDINRNPDSVYFGDTKITIKYNNVLFSSSGGQLLFVIEGHVRSFDQPIQIRFQDISTGQIIYEIYPVVFLLFFVNRNQHLIVETPNAIYKSYEYEITNNGHLIMKDYGTN